MAYFDKHLGEGERVIMVARPSWWLVAWPVALVLAVSTVLSALIAVLGTGLASGLQQVLLVLVAIPCVLVAAFLGIPGLVLVLTTEIVLTDRRVASKHGWLNIAVTSTPLDKVNNINVQQSLMGRLLDYGNVEVTTATAEERDNHLLKHLSKPNLFRDEVSEAIDAGI